MDPQEAALLRRVRPATVAVQLVMCASVDVWCMGMCVFVVCVHTQILSQEAEDSLQRKVARRVRELQSERLYSRVFQGEGCGGAPQL